MSGCGWQDGLGGLSFGFGIQGLVRLGFGGSCSIAWHITMFVRDLGQNEPVTALSTVPQSEPQTLQPVKEFELLSDERKVEAGTPEPCYWELIGNKGMYYMGIM